MHLQDKDIFFLILCSCLVMFMQVGFLCLESGLVRNKNSINVASKNLSDLIFVFIIYWILGFGLMFGDSFSGLIGTSSFILSSQDNPEQIAFFIFQAMFCATASTIVSGAIAERMRLVMYIIVVILISSVDVPRRTGTLHHSHSHLAATASLVITIIVICDSCTLTVER